MTDIHNLIDRIKADPRCEVSPPDGLPSLPEGMQLSADLAVFYSLCGGIVFFEAGSYSVEIFGPLDFREANRVCLPELSYEIIFESLGKDHFSWGCFVFADVGGAHEFVAINLAGEDRGACYDCFWESYPNLDRQLAVSFTEFVAKIYSAEGMQHISEIFDQQ